MVAVKKVAIIPTLLTLGNAVCGFAAIAAASKIGRGDASAAAYSNDPYFALSGLLIFWRGASVPDLAPGSWLVAGAAVASSPVRHRGLVHGLHLAAPGPI